VSARSSASKPEPMLSRAKKERIKFKWRTGFYDTMDLANHFKISEAKIYNLIGRAKLPTIGDKKK